MVWASDMERLFLHGRGLDKLIIDEQGSFGALKDRHLKISWNLIDFCNFKCPYCLNINSKKNIHYEKEDKVIFAVNNLLSLNFNSFEFYLLGGEPTLYPHLDLVIKLLLEDSRVKRIYLMTNGSSLVEKINDERLMTIVSVHPTSVNQIRTWNDENTFYNLLAYPPMFEKVKQIFGIIRVDEITVVRKPPKFENIFDYSEDQKEWIVANDPNNIKPKQLYCGTWKFSNSEVVEQPKYSFMEFNQEKYLSFQDMYCLNNSLNILSNGYFKYTCYNSELSKYSIFEQEIKYKPKIIRCKSKFCNCAGRLNIMKIRDKELAEKNFREYLST